MIAHHHRSAARLARRFSPPTTGGGPVSATGVTRVTSFAQRQRHDRQRAHIGNYRRSAIGNQHSPTAHGVGAVTPDDTTAADTPTPGPADK